MGSLREWILILTLDRLEDIEHAKFRAQAQILVDKSEGIKAFEAYMHLAFPSLAARKKQRESDMLKVLAASAAMGALKVTPLDQPKRPDSRIKRILKE